MRIVVIGNPGRRTDLLAEAVARHGVRLHVIPWPEVLLGHADLRTTVEPGDIVRIDSPGKHFDTEKRLLRLGADDDALGRRIDNFIEERGRIWWPGIWYRGLCRALQMIRSQLDESAPHRLMNDPDEIATMFDKTATHVRLQRAGVRVPPAIGAFSSWSELAEKMRLNRWSRVFVKLAYGSSASGTIALRTNGDKQFQAYTTVELDGRDEEGNWRMYNTRRIRQLTSLRDIENVVNAIAAHGAHAERWIPKAGIHGRAFDLRVVVIAGRAAHTVVRMSDSPMTNLHLLNDRADESRVRARCGEEAWRSAMATCESAMAAFPRSLYGGIDLLIEPNFRRHMVLEVNAFGDLLPGATWNGRDTYDAELDAMRTPVAEVA